LAGRYAAGLGARRAADLRGARQTYPSSGVQHRGTYLGFIENIPYLARLGINSVELLPIHEHYVDDFLINMMIT
jgi:pullulanase/glycogen debranching enzyme